MELLLALLPKRQWRVCSQVKDLFKGTNLVLNIAWSFIQPKQRTECSRWNENKEGRNYYWFSFLNLLVWKLIVLQQKLS